ncbi:MAG: protein kinase [Polyangiaceae bacterium]
MLGWRELLVIDVGSVINGKYRLVRPLGDGGMGSVYEAQHAMLGTRVAVKLLHPELGRRTGLVERFLQEARVAAQIRSPHVVQVTDVDRTPDGHAYIVMELLEGESLSSILDRQRKLAVATACEYAGQILRALEAAHALGVIHRDLKPENVFVTFAAGKPILKLIDFGIAKVRRTELQQRNLTVAGVVMGTAEYMAPEQARSADRVDARSDLYAVGVMLYEMIAGVRPVGGADARVIAIKVEQGDVVPLVQAATETPREIAGLVHRAMAARPELRFPTATDMRLTLESALGRRFTSGPSLPSRAHPGKTVDLTGGRVAAPSTGDGLRTASAGIVESEPHVDTIRAPPIATALTPSSYGGALEIAASPIRMAHPDRTRAAMVALLALSLVLGVGLIALWVGTRGANSGGGFPAPLTAVDSVPTNAPPVATTEVPPALTRTDVPVLAPTRSSLAAPSRPTSPARPAVSAAGAAAPASPIAFPSMLPNGLPPFPAGFPSVLPTALPLPSGFPAIPSSLPSGFPSTLPAWPTMPAPPVPSSSGAGDPTY